MDWDQVLPLVMMAYRSSVHESSGFTPCKMMFDQDVHLPVLKDLSSEMGQNLSVTLETKKEESTEIELHPSNKEIVELSFSNQIKKNKSLKYFQPLPHLPPLHPAPVQKKKTQ